MVASAQDTRSPSSPQSLPPTPHPPSRDQPRPALIRDVGVPPLHQDADPVPEADQVQDVDEEPEPPRERSRETEPTEVGDGVVAPDRRQVPLVQVAEGERRLSAQAAEDVARRM